MFFNIEKIKNLKQQLEPNQVAFITSPFDIFYLTNIKTEQDEAFIFLTKHKLVLFISPLLFSKQIIEKNKDLDLFIEIINFGQKKISQILDSLHIQTIFVDLDFHFSIIKKLYDSKKYKIKDIKKLDLKRDIKTKQEILKINKASNITIQVLKKVPEFLQPGLTEIELKQKINELFYKKKAYDLSFETIVAFGENTSNPHHYATEKKLDFDMPVLIDCGAKFENYNSDFTRTFWFGKKTRRYNIFKKAQELVHKAYLIGFKQLEVNQDLKNIHNSIVDFFKYRNVDKFFIHSTGHGIGLEVHEKPYIFSKSTDKVHLNMCFTIEPGLYFDDFGIRYENTICFDKPISDLLKQFPYLSPNNF